MSIRRLIRATTDAALTRTILSVVLLTAVTLSSSADNTAAAQRRTRGARTTPTQSAPKPSTQTTAAGAITYSCPMHPDVTSKLPKAKCPKCGMNLVKREETTGDAAASAKPGDASSIEDKKKMAEQSSKYFPNHVLVTQDNKPLRFYDELLKGKVVLINFMFTTCTGVCSPMTANLAKVQSYLGERVGREVSMLSITVDPTTDTPERLKTFAGLHKTGPGWYFLTGKKENVDWVLYKLGGYVEDKEKHTSVLIIGNEATGDWMKVHAMAKPSDIAEAVIKLIGKGEEQPRQ